MFKKMMLLAGMALAAIAFAVPASASAFEWTDGGEAFEGTVEEEFTGRLSFGNPAPGADKFGCDVHVRITAHGLTDEATLTKFEVTTSTCSGEGNFTGCELETDSVSGLPANVTITGTNALKISSAIDIHNSYKSPCFLDTSTLTVPANAVTITLQNSGTTLASSVSGIIEAHSILRSTTQEVTSSPAVFGSITGNGTLSVS